MNGLNNGGTHGKKGVMEKPADTDQCHDITVYTAIGLAAAHAPATEFFSTSKTQSIQSVSTPSTIQITPTGIPLRSPTTAPK